MVINHIIVVYYTYYNYYAIFASVKASCRSYNIVVIKSFIFIISYFFCRTSTHKSTIHDFTQLPTFAPLQHWPLAFFASCYIEERRKKLFAFPSADLFYSYPSCLAKPKPLTSPLSTGYKKHFLYRNLLAPLQACCQT